MANFTAHGNQGANITLFYSKGFLEYELMILIGLNLFVSVTASLGNALILAALHKQSPLHPSSKLLFRNLAATDLAVGIIVEPFHITHLISVLNEQWNISRFAVATFHIAGYILCGVSMFTLTAISVDRLLALLLGLRYKQIVTLKRICVICIGFWFVSIFTSIMLILRHQIPLPLVYSAVSLCLVISVFSYAKIFFTLRHNQLQAQGQQNQNVLPNRARYKRTVKSALWVQLALLVCYLPYVITHIAALKGGQLSSFPFARSLTATLLFLNSSLNPVLYCWKIREVRQAVKGIVKGLFCSTS